MMHPMTELRRPAAARLATVVRGNGWFSLCSGAALALGTGTLGGWFGLPTATVAVVGATLVPYGMLLALGSSRPATLRHLAVFATAGDMAWVLAAAALLLIPGTMSAAGKAALACVSMVVLWFAAMQVRELRRTGQ